MNKYLVWIYDEESGCDSPMVCTASTVAEARKRGRAYIRMWNLVGAEIVKIEVVKRMDNYQDCKTEESE